MKQISAQLKEHGRGPRLGPAGPVGAGGPGGPAAFLWGACLCPESTVLGRQGTAVGWLEVGL